MIDIENNIPLPPRISIWKDTSGHQHTLDDKDPDDKGCLTCEIFALIARNFPDMHERGILHALVECVATVVCVSAQPDREEELAHEIANDVEHVTRVIKAAGGPYSI
jgi:hypothetical protein